MLLLFNMSESHQQTCILDQVLQLLFNVLESTHMVPGMKCRKMVN